MLHAEEPKISVLLVEDDDAVRRSMQLLLRSHGYAVRAYPSAVGLAQNPAALGCGCIVADLMMPHTDAIQLLAEFQATGWKGTAVLISGHLGQARETTALKAGYDAVLSKPISNSVLIRTMDELRSKQGREPRTYTNAVSRPKDATSG